MEPQELDDRSWAADALERVGATFVETALGGFAAWTAAQHLDNTTLVGVVGLAAAAAATVGKSIVAKRFGSPNSASLVQ